jgi:DNA polymerase-3 subunit delta'
MKTIHGHAAVLELLNRAVALDRVAHAYAFVGPSGVGRKLTGLAFAQALLCSSRPLTLPSPPGGGEEGLFASGTAPEPSPLRGPRLAGCGRCSACRKVERSVHPDLTLVSPTPPKDNARGNPAIRLDTIREVERLAALRPVEGPLKVFILDDAEKMTPETPQAFLKTLEEPPDRTVFILILPQVRALPPTVLSRCQIVRFTPLAEADAVTVLRENGVEEAAARFLARVCQGRVGLALARDPGAWRERRDDAVALLERVAAEGGEALLTSVEALGRDRAQAAELIEAVWLWHRDLLCARAGADPQLFISVDRQDDLSLAAGARSWAAILDGLAACREAWQAIQGNVSPRLTLEVMLGRLALRAA